MLCQLEPGQIPVVPRRGRVRFVRTAALRLPRFPEGGRCAEAHLRRSCLGRERPHPERGQRRNAQTTISITAQTANTPVAGLVWATYGKTAQISGATSDGLPGTTVELQKSAFPFKAGFTAAGEAQTGDGGSYSFTAKPTLATKYRVVLASDPTSQSAIVNVYVAADWINLPSSACSGLSCHKRFGNHIVYPAAVAKRESGKAAYFYFGVRYGSHPTPPSRVRLVTTGHLRRLHGNTYRVTFSVTFSTVQAYYYEWAICTQDTEAVDGLGLPGHHSCGGRSIPYSVIRKGYIG